MAHIITVTNCETGQTIEREMNADELAQYNAIKAKQTQAAEAAAEAAADKAAATAKLKALGLTADDLKALGL